ENLRSRVAVFVLPSRLRRGGPGEFGGASRDHPVPAKVGLGHDAAQIVRSSPDKGDVPISVPTRPIVDYESVGTGHPDINHVTKINVEDMGASNAAEAL